MTHRFSHPSSQQMAMGPENPAPLPDPFSEYQRKKAAFLRSDYLKHLIEIENPRRDPKARPGGSSTASGLFQMTDPYRADGRRYVLENFYLPKGSRMQEEDILYAKHLSDIKRLENKLGRLPYDWEVYAAYNLGRQDAPNFLERYHQLHKAPEKNKINLNDESKDFLGAFLNSHPGIKYKLIAANHNIFYPGTYKDPDDLNQSEIARIKHMLDFNQRRTDNLNPFTVRNLARYYKRRFGGLDDSRTWDGSSPPRDESR